MFPLNCQTLPLPSPSPSPFPLSHSPLDQWPIFLVSKLRACTYVFSAIIWILAARKHRDRERERGELLPGVMEVGESAFYRWLLKCVLHFWGRRKLNWQLYINRYPHRASAGWTSPSYTSTVAPLPLPTSSTPLPLVHFLHLVFRNRSQLQPGSCRRWLCTCPEIVRLCTQFTRGKGRGRVEGRGGGRGAQQDTRNLCSLHIIQMMPHYISHSMVSSLQLNAPQCSPSIWHLKSVL